MYSFFYTDDAIKSIKNLDAEWKLKIKKNNRTLFE